MILEKPDAEMNCHGSRIQLPLLLQRVEFPLLLLELR
jgi:hypothetical protein